MSEQIDDVLPVLQNARRIRYNESYIILTVLLTAGIAVVFMGCCAFFLITCVTRRMKRTEKTRPMPMSHVSALPQQAVHTNSIPPRVPLPGSTTTPSGPSLVPPIGGRGSGADTHQRIYASDCIPIAPATSLSLSPSFGPLPPQHAAAAIINAETATAREDHPPQYTEIPQAELTR